MILKQRTSHKTDFLQHKINNFFHRHIYITKKRKRYTCHTTESTSLPRQAFACLAGQGQNSKETIHNISRYVHRNKMKKDFVIV